MMAARAAAGLVGDINAYCAMLERRIVELLLELDIDDRRARMRELGDAAREGGVDAPAPDPHETEQWAGRLVSGNLRTMSEIQGRLAYEWMPNPKNIGGFDEIVSALRPAHDLL